jgi:hypothetical protein
MRTVNKDICIFCACILHVLPGRYGVYTALWYMAWKEMKEGDAAWRVITGCISVIRSLFAGVLHRAAMNCGVVPRLNARLQRQQRRANLRCAMRAT